MQSGYRPLLYTLRMCNAYRLTPIERDDLILWPTQADYAKRNRKFTLDLSESR